MSSIELRDWLDLRLITNDIWLIARKDYVDFTIVRTHFFDKWIVNIAGIFSGKTNANNGLKIRTYDV